MKNIIITGASGNLGQVVVAEFLKGDYHLNLCMSKEIESNERQTVYTPDLTNPFEVGVMVEKIIAAKGKIDGIVHLVGTYLPGTLDSTSMADIDKMINVNFKTSFNLTKSLLPYFKEAHTGKFVFIGAKAAMYPAMANSSVAYAFSKQMLPQLAHLINESENAKNISAHVLLPHTLDTELNRKSMPDADFSKFTSPQKLALAMRHIVEGLEKRIVIEF